MVRGFRSFHPIILLLYYLFAMAALMLYQHPMFLALATVAILLMNFMLDGGLELRKWRAMILIMAVLTLVLTPFFNQRGNHLLFYLFEKQVYLEAIWQGVMISLTLVCILTLFLTFNLVITPDKFVFLFSKIMPQWALLTMLSLRFVPLLRKRLLEIGDVQSIKGFSLKTGSVKGRAQSGMLFLQTLLTWSLEESIQTADSMTARGYGLGKRSKYQPYYMKKRDWLAFAFLLVSGSLVLFGWWLGDGVLTLLPVLEPVWLSGREWLYWILFFMMIGFPIWTEGKEMVKWKFLRRIG
ncbi:energy-coupling factor transporter transmembrane component T [Mesobacillus maritimus]|uniref:Energy-coupling factor transporter transmembrane protein EcfT n=1 Tax=Mesobacillus maritimus TaxID=1643336 RepID=A0ABS7KAF3_9BACI|nr:energy-coupling factor transporter transmembrane component T [Mesobacillus maritimus]MBY0099232.1 energy-coupling factor transporter transmembrane protein EcfT [Mesobacillus maritimus]